MSLLCLILLSLFTPDSTRASATDSLYRELVTSLYFSSATVRADFARLSIEELAAAHRAETSGSRFGGRGSTSGWISGVESFNAELLRLARSITPASRIGIHTGAGGYTQLLIDGEFVILSSPRVSRQAEFEQRIVQRFCELYLCEELLRVQGRLPTSSRKIRFGMSTQQDAGLSCRSSDGLELLFYGRERLQYKRALCHRIFSELDLLARGIAQELAAGLEVDWGSLALIDSGGEGQRLLLNGDGDFIVVQAPTCAEAPALLGRVLPWLVMQAEGTEHHGIVLVITNTEELLNQPDDPVLPRR